MIATIDNANIQRNGWITNKTTKNNTDSVATIKPNNTLNILSPLQTTTSYFLHDSTMKTKRKAPAIKPGPVIIVLEFSFW